METLNKICSILLVSLLVGCSSVKVTDSWRGIETESIKNKRVLVVSKTDEKNVRIRFEQDLVQKLNDEGFRSIESFKKFPDLNPNKTVKDEEVDSVIKNLRDNDIDVVILTSLVDVQDYKKIVDDRTTHTVSYPVYWRYGKYRGFSFHHIDYTTSNPIEIEGKKYILETIVYDLTLSREEQLVSIITLEVDNPKTLGTTSKDFSKQIVKNLIK